MPLFRTPPPRWPHEWQKPWLRRSSPFLALAPVLAAVLLGGAAHELSGIIDGPVPNLPQHVEGFTIDAVAAEPYVVDGAEVALFGYGPHRIRQHLGLTADQDGAGTTIAVVVAYHDPRIVEEVNGFSSRFGLPLVCDGRNAPDCFVLEVVQPDGRPEYRSVWAKETALDVQWAHAIAPRARIVLVEAIDDGTDSLGRAIDAAARVPGVVVISNSWGGESPSGFDRHCALTAIVCVFAAGNQGIREDILTRYPTVAQSPYVIAVGGTTLVLNTDGEVFSEAAWAGSSGGMSRARQIPGFQLRLRGLVGRAIPDVSFNANSSTGYAVLYVTSEGMRRWAVFGGTSAATPQWAALIAIAVQQRKVPFSATTMEIHDALYRTPGEALYDVVEGRNGSCDRCRAERGWDFATGLGSPRKGILDLLIQIQPARR